MNNTCHGRHDTEVRECLLPPFEKLVALPVALEFDLGIAPERIGCGEEIHLDGMVNHQVYGDERIDFLRVAAQPGHRGPHGSQVHHGGDTCEILHHHAGRQEWNTRTHALRSPHSNVLDVGLIDLAALCHVEQVFCDRLLDDFRQQHERDVAAARPERVMLDVAIALDDQERVRVERMLAEEGLAAEIRFTDVLKLVIVPTLDEGRVLLWTAVYEFDGSDYVLLAEPQFASPGNGTALLELASSSGTRFGFSLASLLPKVSE